MGLIDTTTRVTVSRLEFQYAIEAGIAYAGLTGEHAEALRKVGRDATLVARGHMDWHGVGCPLQLAGLYQPGLTPEEEVNLLGSATSKFFTWYDDVLGAITRDRNSQHRSADLVDILS